MGFFRRGIKRRYPPREARLVTPLKNPRLLSINVVFGVALMISMIIFTLFVLEAL